MDPISQGVLGASASQSFSTRHETGLATVSGFVAGLAADMDVFIRSSTDPLLFLEYHRQFTHSLLFIPVGATLCALLLYFTLIKSRLSFKKTWCYCALGYATHALLDSCTTYGTMLFWPFSDVRIAWNNLSIVDPLFTIPLLILVLTGWRKQSPVYARIALGWVILFATLGVIQKENAESMGMALALDRGHEPLNLGAKPSFGNMILWKIVYEYQGRYYVDAVRVGIVGKVFTGDSIKKLDLETDFSWLQPDSQQARDVERFRWFSMGYLAVDQQQDNLIVDVRYSMLPNEIHALWGIRLNPDADNTTHVSYETRRDGTAMRTKILMEMLFN